MPIRRRKFEHGKKVLERFWAKVDIRGPDECWPWIANRLPKGYGQFYPTKGNGVLAHRFSYSLANPKENIEGKQVRHTCDNPPCCNPSHLLSGTNKDNVQDMLRRGRVNRSPRIHGEAHYRCKLTLEQVTDIRIRYTPGCRINGCNAMAREFKVGVSTVHSILIGNSWKYGNMAGKLGNEEATL